MSEQVITRRSEQSSTRQKRTSCQLTADGQTLKYGGFRVVLVARGQKTHRVGVPIGQEDTFFRAALVECGWTPEEIANANLKEVADVLLPTLFDLRHKPFGGNMAFDWRVDASEVCNEQTGAGMTSVGGARHMASSTGSGSGNALNALKQQIDAMRSRSTPPANGALPPATSALPPAKGKK